MTQSLAQSVQANTGKDSNLRVGIVQSIDSTTSLTVNIGGGIITDLPFLASYSPAVGDNVNVARFDATWLVLGIVGPAGLTVIKGTITESTTNVTLIGTTETDLPYLASDGPVILRAGHMYEFFGFTLTTQTAAIDLFELRARRDAPTPGGTQIGYQRFSNTTSANSWGQSTTFIYEATVDDSFDLFWSLVRVSGSGTITGAPTVGVASAYMKVTDLGLNTTVSGSPWSLTT